MKRVAGSRLLVLLGILVSACGSDHTPTAPSQSAQTNVLARPIDSGGARAAMYSTPGVIGPSVIGFPPRNEPNVFFQDLNVLYRDVLRRTQSAPTYVDPEGENVWLTEYFRFYLNGCSHDQAVTRTLNEITSGAVESVCGAETPTFPPRDLPNAFQLRLELTYRDVLRRPQGLSFVDSEGANVWLAEYLRFRVSGCGHADAENKVFAEIRGSGNQSTCAPAPTPAPTPTPTPPPSGGAAIRYDTNSTTCRCWIGTISLKINSATVGTMSCTGSVTVPVAPGTYQVSACDSTSCGPTSTATVALNQVQPYTLTCSAAEISSKAFPSLQVERFR